MITISKVKLKEFKESKPRMEDFIIPTKKLAVDLKTISNRIEVELTKLELEDKAFWDAYKEVIEYHDNGHSMDDIKEQYRQELLKKENEIEKNDVLEMFKNKLQSLKAALSVNGEF